MSLEDEILIDEEVKEALDKQLLAVDGVTSGNLFGGVSYSVNDIPFAILLEGVIAMNLPDEQRRLALTLAGVSPFYSPTDDEGLDDWVQLVVLLPEDLPQIAPWLEAAYGYAAVDSC